MKIVESLMIGNDACISRFKQETKIQNISMLLEKEDFAPKDAAIIYMLFLYNFNKQKFKAAVIDYTGINSDQIIFSPFIKWYCLFVNKLKDMSRILNDKYSIKINSESNSKLYNSVYQISRALASSINSNSKNIGNKISECIDFYILVSHITYTVEAQEYLKKMTDIGNKICDGPLLDIELLICDAIPKYFQKKDYVFNIEPISLVRKFTSIPREFIVKLGNQQIAQTKLMDNYITINNKYTLNYNENVRKVIYSAKGASDVSITVNQDKKGYTTVNLNNNQPSFQIYADKSGYIYERLCGELTPRIGVSRFNGSNQIVSVSSDATTIEVIIIILTALIMSHNIIMPTNFHYANLYRNCSDEILLSQYKRKSIMHLTSKI